MSTPPATHLHVHSQYSLLRATPPVGALAARAAQDGLARLALTDTNALYGMVAFARACAAVNVLPIAGMALAVAAADGEATATPDMVILLARNLAGYRSLCRLSSALQASPQREQLASAGLAWETLAHMHAGLICLCGGRRSQIEQAVRAERPERARMLLARYAGLFDDDCYLSLELHSAADEHIGRDIVRLADRFGVGVVAVQPVFCMDPEEQRLLRVLDAIERNRPLDEAAAAEQERSAPATALSWQSPAAMAARFQAFPGALALAGAIAEQCDPFVLDDRPVWPVLPLAPGQSADTALATQAHTGLAARFGDEPAAGARLQRELAAIAARGYAPFFLIVADIVAHARRQAIPVSTRGSVANSLVAFCVGITTVDPIANDLLFERFLNPARAGLPDIDLDFCSRRRDEVLDYVRQTYGTDRVALVATVSTLRPRSAVRETGKAHGLDDATLDRLVHLLPDAWHPDPRRRARSDQEDVLGKLSDERERQAVRDAFALVGQPDHLSVHPGGVVITPGPLTDYVPVQWAPKGFLITQFDHDDVEAIGLPKIDLLGIRALTVLAHAAALVRAHHMPDFTLEAIPLDDPITGELLTRGETVAVFQCESTGAQRTLRQLKAHSVRDLAVANAFFKPGPATGGMATHFIRRYRGEEAVHYLHPALEPILRRTSGVLLFQEQILRVAREVAGLSWEEADHLRRGMSKFQSKEMDAMRNRFIAGCQRPPPIGPGLTATQAQTLWEQVKAFAGYGFNQGHATAYADVSYRSAYLKAHWPAAFLCARLADWGGFHHQAIYIAEARRLGIAVRPPHVNHSTAHFSLGFEPGAHRPQPVLWMGLSQVRDLRHAGVAAVVAARAEGEFSDLADLVRRARVQPKELLHLVQCGALDGLGASRAALLADAASAGHGKRAQMSFTFVDEPVAPESLAQRIAWETHVLGFPVSVHPLALVERPVGVITVAAAAAHKPGVPITVLGTRLPGWTGGAGFFLGDEQSYVVAVTPRHAPAPTAWQVVQASGRWVVDEWGGGALHCDRWSVL